MTRPAGTVPVRLARHRALCLADWLTDFVPPQKTILGLAGTKAPDPEQNQKRELAHISDLIAILEGKRKGRRRGKVATYHVPREAIEALHSSDIAQRIPRPLRAVVRLLVRQSLRKRGTRLTPAAKRKNIKNGYYAPETVRRYKYEDRLRRDRIRAAEEWKKLSGPEEMGPPPRPGSEASILSLSMAHRLRAHSALFGSRTGHRR